MRKANHADQHQHRRPNETVFRAATHDLHALRLGGHSGGLVGSLAEFEKCHDVSAQGSGVGQVLGMKSGKPVLQDTAHGVEGSEDHDSISGVGSGHGGLQRRLRVA